jgi:hypothetical protein
MELTSNTIMQIMEDSKTKYSPKELKRKDKPLASVE